MARLSALDTSTRTRIASLLYKLAIRVMKVSKRPLDPSRAVLALDHAQGNRVKKLVQFFSPEKSKPPSIQKVLATRTVAPGQGDGIRIDLVFGPLRLLEHGGDLGAVSKKTVLNPGSAPQGLVPLDKLQEVATSVFGGVLPNIKIITADVRDMSDRPFRIEHGYDKDLGARAWRIVHNGGPKDGQVAYYENPHIQAQLEKALDRQGYGAKDKGPDAELDPYQPAVFKSAEEASLVLNQLTRGTSISSRNFPKFREYTIYLKYSAVYLQNPSNGDSALYTVFDRLLSDADNSASEDSKSSSEERKSLIEKAVAWIREKDVSPAALLSTLKAKDPELAKRYEEVLPDVVDRLEEAA